MLKLTFSIHIVKDKKAAPPKRAAALFQYKLCYTLNVCGVY